MKRPGFSCAQATSFSLVTFADVVIPTLCPADPIQEVIHREWTATDECLNADSCLQAITVLKIVGELDIKPGSCPNPFNRRAAGVLPVALVGNADIDVSMVDLSTLQISRTDCVGSSGVRRLLDPSCFARFSGYTEEVRSYERSFYPSRHRRELPAGPSREREAADARG